MNTHEAARHFYARLVSARAGISDARITEAFASVRRERYLGPGPWYVKAGDGYLVTDTDDPVVLYQDVLVGLAPEKGINNGEPSLHARCLAAARPQPGDAGIHVGAGTGYYTAILAWLVGDAGRVDAYEIEPDMARRAAENLAKLATVSVHARSGLDSALPSAAVIYVNAGCTHVPAAWLDALSIGGRLVLPLTPDASLGCMLLVTRTGETTYAARIFSTAAFIPCIGVRDDEESWRLAESLDSRSTDEVRSLHRGSTPDHLTAWHIGKDYWLSTAEP